LSKLKEPELHLCFDPEELNDRSRTAKCELFKRFKPKPRPAVYPFTINNEEEYNDMIYGEDRWQTMYELMMSAITESGRKLESTRVFVEMEKKGVDSQQSENFQPSGVFGACPTLMDDFVSAEKLAKRLAREKQLAEDKEKKSSNKEEKKSSSRETVPQAKKKRNRKNSSEEEAHNSEEDVPSGKNNAKNKRKRMNSSGKKNAKNKRKKSSQAEAQAMSSGNNSPPLLNNFYDSDRDKHANEQVQKGRMGREKRVNSRFISALSTSEEKQNFLQSAYVSDLREHICDNPWSRKQVDEAVSKFCGLTGEMTHTLIVGVDDACNCAQLILRIFEKFPESKVTIIDRDSTQICKLTQELKLKMAKLLTLFDNRGQIIFENFCIITNPVRHNHSTQPWSHMFVLSSGKCMRSFE
jgi:hypothetical protein